MLISTDTHAYTLNGDENQAAPEPCFGGNGIQRVAEGAGCSVIALDGGDLSVLSEGGSRTLSTGIDDPIESLLILQEDPLSLLVGTEGPHIYRIADDSAERIQTFEDLECRDDWYTPWGGPAAVRSLASTADGWVYADIHVGSIMRSPDRGASWEPVTPDLHIDVHQVATSPREDQRVYANTAHAVYISTDCGASWQHRADGFPVLYGRAIAVHPEDTGCLLATVSEGPGDNVKGYLFRTDDTGETWTHVTDGFPETTRGNIDTFQVAFSPSGRAFAVVDRTLYQSLDRGSRWTPCWEATEPIAMLSCHT